MSNKMKASLSVVMVIICLLSPLASTKVSAATTYRSRDNCTIYYGYDNPYRFQGAYNGFPVQMPTGDQLLLNGTRFLTYTDKDMAAYFTWNNPTYWSVTLYQYNQSGQLVATIGDGTQNYGDGFAGYYLQGGYSYALLLTVYDQCALVSTDITLNDAY